MQDSIDGNGTIHAELEIDIAVNTVPAVKAEKAVTAVQIVNTVAAVQAVNSTAVKE